MSTGRLVLAIVVVFVLISCLGYLLHARLLAPDYAAVGPAVFRMTEVKFPFIFGANLLIAIAMVLIYVRGVENKGWFGQGMRFGILIWAVSAAPGFMYDYATIHISDPLFVKQVVGHLVIALINGLAIAAIVRE